MLTNKKTSIRLLALVLALMMAIAVLAGCSQPTQDDEARAKAEAAEKAAEEAKKSADSIAKAAEDLAKQLEQAKADAEQAKKDAEKAQKEAEAAKSSIKDLHDGTTAVTEKPVDQKEFDDITDKIPAEYLAQFTELKNLYLTTRMYWYTEANYNKLAKVFEDASYELYRLTTNKGVQELINETESKAAAVPDVVSEAAAVQAQIATFGDVYETLYTTDEDKVITARNMFDKWVNDYATRIFGKNGFVFTYKLDANKKEVIDIAATGERKIVDFAKKMTADKVYININDNTNSLLYAEAKLAALYAYAEDATQGEMIAQLIISGGLTEAEAEAIVEIFFKDGATSVELNKAAAEYNKVKRLIEKLGGPYYAECKANAQLIEDCYTQYRIYYYANGGDDSDIGLKPYLTGEEFVKMYVLCLYDGELREYQNDVYDYVKSEIVSFFMNRGNTSTIKAGTTWGEYLALNNGSAEMGYLNDYFTVLSIDGSSKLTFAVENDRINVYKDGTLYDSINVGVDGQKIENELNKVVIRAYNAAYALDYTNDFKGKKSLTDAYLEIDQIYAKAIVEMAQVYYNEVIMKYVKTGIDEMLDDVTDIYANTNGTAPTGYAYANKSYVYAKNDYYKADNDTYLQISSLLKTAQKVAEAVKVSSYEDLNKIANAKKNIYNIADQKLFDVVNDANGAIAGITLHTTASSATDCGSAFETVLKAAFTTLNDSLLELSRETYKLSVAIEVHETAIEYAMDIDELVGIANNETDFSKGYLVGSTLIGDFGAAYKKVVGDKNYKEENVYKNLVAARDAARADVLSVKLLNDDGTYAIDKEEYDAFYLKADKSKANWYTENKNTLSVKDSSKNNVGLKVVVDPEIVAEYVIINKFATGADAIIAKFCDGTRDIIAKTLADGVENYRQHGYFGDLDNVKLEAEMQYYIDFLTSLTKFAGVGASFSTASFSLKNQPLSAAQIAAMTVDQKATKDGSKTNYSYVLHVDDMDEYVDDITGVRTSTNAAAWYTMVKGRLTTYFGIHNDSATYIDGGLTLVKTLRYTKDSLTDGKTDAIIDIKNAAGTTIGSFASINSIYGEYLGVVDAKDDSKFSTLPKLDYELKTLRTTLYLKQLADVKDRIVAKVDAMNIVDGATGISAGLTPAQAYDAASAQVVAIMVQATNPTPVTATEAEAGTSVTLDDYSFDIAWMRYYTQDTTLVYNWNVYDEYK